VGLQTDKGDMMNNRIDADLQAALLQADAIFVGKVLNLGLPNTKAPGQATYHGVRVEVLRVLKGSVPSEVTLTLVSRQIHAKVEEPIPQVGRAYIFFTKSSDRATELAVIKFMPGDDASITHVQQGLQQ
jgi:hypothetical protein